MSERDDNTLDARIRDVVARRARQQAQDAHDRIRYPEPVAYPAPVRVREWINSLAFRVVRGRVLFATLLVTGALVLLWMSLHLIRYDAISEIRLFSDYKAHPITDMAVDDRYVYLATDGNSLQRYDKQTYLWKTVTVPHTDDNPSHSLREVIHDPVNQRLWLLSQEKNIITAGDALTPRDFETVLKTGTTWEYFDFGTDLRQAFLADDGARLYFGSAGYGAAAYHLQSHTWIPFKGASDSVRYLLPHQQTVWVAGNTGVHAFDPIGGLDSTWSLAGEDIRHLALGSGLHTAVNANQAAFARLDTAWTPPFGGGHGLSGLDAATITRALLTPNHRLLIAAEGQGLALYDTTLHRWQARAESGQTYRQLAVLGDQLLVAADTGLRVISYGEGFIPSRPLHSDQRVTLQHNNGARLFYATEDEALWTYAASQARQLIDTPPEIGTPGAVRHVLTARRRGRPGFWLATTDQGLLRYDSNTHRLEGGPYSFIGGGRQPVDQLFENGDGLLARAGGQIYQYVGSDWVLNQNHYGTEHVIPVAPARFLFLQANGTLEATNASERYFNGQTAPLLTPIDPTSTGLPGGSPLPLQGEIDPASETIYLALPGEAVWAYRQEHQRWDRLVSRVPADLQSMHWASEAWSLVTQAGHLYVADDTARVADTPDFSPVALPGPLDRVVDAVAMDDDEQVLLAWPERLALYDPGTGRWQDNTPARAEADAFEELILWQWSLYARTAANRLWLHQSEQDLPSAQWASTGFPDSTIAKLDFGATNIWYRFDDNTAGRFAPVNTWEDRDSTDRFFTGSFPGLERATHFVNENERFVWVLNDQAVGRYDADRHHWQRQPFAFTALPGEAVRQALFADEALYVITNHRLIRFKTDTDRITQEQRPFVSSMPMLLLPDDQGVRLWLKKDHRIDQLDVTESWQQQPNPVFDGGHFEGNLNDIVDAREHEDALWMIDRTGHFGLYKPRTHAWRNHTVPQGETPIRFIPLQHHLILETRLSDPSQRHLYRYDAARDTLRRVDVCTNRPAFRYYPDGPLLLTCEDGSIAQTHERPNSLQIDPLPALDGASRLDYLYVRDPKKTFADTFVGLFADSTGARTVLYGDTLAVTLPATARSMTTLKHVARDLADRLWILGDDQRLYVARFQDLSAADQANLDIRHFEQKMKAGEPAIDFAAALWGGRAPAITGFAVYDPSANINLWITTPEYVYKYHVPLWSLPNEQRRARLPHGRQPVQHLYAPPGREAVVVQEDAFYQLRRKASWWRRPFSVVTGYNLGDWAAIDTATMPPIKPEPVDEGYASRDTAQARWRITRAEHDTVHFAYKPGTTFKALRHDDHTFLKDHILGAASLARSRTYLNTLDGLLVYDLSSEQVIGELRTATGQSMARLDTLLSKPTGPAAQPALWVRHEGQWKQVVETDAVEVRLEPGDYAYTVRRTADEAVVWQQTTPTTTALTLGETAAVVQGRLRTDVLVDMAVLDTTVFYSTPTGTWWGSEGAGVPGWRFDPALANARFQETAEGRLFARTDDGGVELFATGRRQPTTTAPPDTTRVLRRDIEIDGTRWQVVAGRPGLRAFSGNTARRQDATTSAFADDIVRDAVFDEDRGVYWVASQGGLWRFDPRIGRADRKTIFAPNTDFRRFFKDRRRLFAVDADDRLYALETGAWQRADDMSSDRLVKTLDNGRIRFVQDHTNTVRLTRRPGQRGAVWTRHASGWHLAGDALENAERLGNSLWTYAPDLGFARYPIGDFSTAETILRPSEPMPERVDFFNPPGTDTLYVRDRATARYWRLIDTRLEGGTARDWERSYAEATEGRLAWKRLSPDNPTLTMTINGVPLQTPFSNRRLVFDDYHSIFAPDDDTVFLGNDVGLFHFTLTGAQDLRLLDYFPLYEGVKAITEAHDQLYVQTQSDGVRRFDPVRGLFDGAGEDSLFLPTQPVLGIEEDRFVLRNERRAIPAFAGRLEVNLTGNRPLFTENGTFSFDAYTAMLPLSDSTWLGATAWGLVEATASAEGAHRPTAFYAYDQTFDEAVETILDIRQRDDAVYLHGRDALGRDLFFTWNGRRAQPYDEADRRIFAHPQVLFHPHEVKWDQEMVPHTDATVLKLIGDPGYPLYIEDAEEPGRGRFSFDDIQSIWAHDNLLWAGSKGGLLQFRYLPERAPNRLVFETIYTEQTNLAAYHIVDVQRGARDDLSIDLREQTPGDTLVKQTLVLGGWNARTLDATLAPVGTVGNLTVEQDALGFRTRLRTDTGAVLLEGYAFGHPPGKTARLGSTIYFVATDSLLFAYDETTNASARIEAVYAQEASHPVEMLQPPLALTRHEEQVVVMDGAARFFTMKPGTRIDPAAARTALFGTRYASLGELDFYVQDGQLIVSGDAVPRMRLADKAGRYAMAVQDDKLVLYTSPTAYTVWSYEEGIYRKSAGGGPFIAYAIRPGDTIYKIIAAQGLAPGPAGDPAVERMKTQIIERNRSNPALYFEDGDARLRVRGRIEIPSAAAAPRVRRPAKGYFYGSRDSVRLETPPIDLLTRTLYAEDSTHSVFWNGERFVEVERRRNLAQQYYPPDSVAVWSLRHREDGSFALLPQRLTQPPASYYERERLRLQTWEGPAWDPFVERRMEVAVRGMPVSYRVTPRRLLEREGTLIHETDDWQQAYPIRRIVALEKDKQTVWVATRDRLIRVNPY